MRDIKIWHLLNVCFVSYLMSYYIGPRGTKIQLDNFLYHHTSLLMENEVELSCHMEGNVDGL